jgi:plastocyanin
VRRLSVTVAVIVPALWACSTASTHVATRPATTQGNQVVISDYQFVPKTLTVSVGTTVTWVNHDMARHTVTRDASVEPFNSGLLGNQETFSHTFRIAGTYGYICVPHSGMQGTIVVQ